MPHPFHIVDVFAEARYTGNPLAVVLDAGDLDPEEMQRIASEMNYSETTFVLSRAPRDGGYPARIFTPSQELPFAGHPTLGTAWVLRHEVASDAPSQLLLDLGVGRVPVSFETTEGEIAWLTGPPVELGPTCPPDRIAPALRLRRDDIDPWAPVQRASAGIDITIVPVRSLAVLHRSRLDPDRFEPLRGEGFPGFVLLFCRETHRAENDVCTRFFFEAHGVREDPATGSASVCLGAYLVTHGLFSGSDLSIRVEQGYEIGRPSLLRVRARQVGDGIEVRVGGRVLPAARGELV